MNEPGRDSTPEGPLTDDAVLNLALETALAKTTSHGKQRGANKRKSTESDKKEEIAYQFGMPASAKRSRTAGSGDSLQQQQIDYKWPRISDLRDSKLDKYMDGKGNMYAVADTDEHFSAPWVRERLAAFKANGDNSGKRSACLFWVVRSKDVDWNDTPSLDNATIETAALSSKTSPLQTIRTAKWQVLDACTHNLAKTSQSRVGWIVVRQID